MISYLILLLSANSNGDYSFEQSILSKTNCKVYTFDCTYDGRSINQDRHVYNKWCAGKLQEGKPDYLPLDVILQRLKLTHVDIMKVDIEGYEFEFFASMATSHFLSSSHASVLPRQIVTEYHSYAGSPALLVNLFLTLAHLGYVPFARDDNLRDSCCSEISLIRVGNSMRY